MATLVEEFVARLGWDVPAGEQRKLAQYEKSLDTVIGGFAKLAKVAAVAGAALFGAMAVVNQKTAENARLARSIGVTVEEFEAWGDVLDDIGIKGDAVAKMMLDFNKNIGELKGGRPLAEISDALKMVGVRLEDIQDLSPNEQLLAFIDAAKGVEDTQVAIGAASKLLGRQGKFIIPYLRDLDGSMTEILRKSINIIQLTDEGAQGAEAWAREMDTLKTAMGTWGKQILGLLGGALAPYLKLLTDWIANNKELIQQKTREWVDRISRAVLFLAPKIGWLVRKIGDLIDWVDDVVKSMGGFESVLRLIAVFLGSALFFKGILVVQSLMAAWKAAGAAAMWANAKMLLIPAAIALLVFALQDVYTFLEGGKSITGGLLKMAGVSETTIEGMREGWRALKEDLTLWKDGVGKTLITFWKELGNGFDMFVVEPIRQGVEKIKGWLSVIPGFGDLGPTTTGSTGSRSDVYGFGGKNKGDRDFTRMNRDPRISNEVAVNWGRAGLAQVEKLKAIAGMTPKQLVENKNTFNLSINSTADAKKVAQMARRELERAMAQAKLANSTGIDR